MGLSQDKLRKETQEATRRDEQLVVLKVELATLQEKFRLTQDEVSLRLILVAFNWVISKLRQGQCRPRFKLTRKQLQAHFVPVQSFVKVSLKVQKLGFIKEVDKGRNNSRKIAKLIFQTFAFPQSEWLTSNLEDRDLLSGLRQNACPSN